MDLLWTILRERCINSNIGKIFNLEIATSRILGTRNDRFELVFVRSFPENSGGRRIKR